MSYRYPPCWKRKRTECDRILQVEHSWTWTANPRGSVFFTIFFYIFQKCTKFLGVELRNFQVFWKKIQVLEWNPQIFRKFWRFFRYFTKMYKILKSKKTGKQNIWAKKTKKSKITKSNRKSMKISIFLKENWDFHWFYIFLMFYFLFLCVLLVVACVFLWFLLVTFARLFDFAWFFVCFLQSVA